MSRPTRRVYRECAADGCEDLAIVYRGVQELWCKPHKDAFHAELDARFSAAAKAIDGGWDLFERVKANHEGQIADGETSRMRSR